MANTIEELQQLQRLPLDVKISKTKQRIKEWVEYWGEDGVYVSFSGGKDSTVLLHLVRELYPNIKALFVDTGLEYPEIREFVKTFDNVDWVRPKKTFKQVIEEYGYPFISKEVSDCVSLAKRGYKSGIDKLNGVDKDGKHCEFRKGFKKWKFLIDMPWNISDECCFINKKTPAKDYEHKTERKAIIGTLASEGGLRKTSWLRTGCNAFESNRPISSPLSFWVEQDILLYIKMYNIQICSVYGDVVEDAEELDGQMCLHDYDPSAGIFDRGRPLLKTTGCQRTGCMFCAYGAHLRNDSRFVDMKQTHPKQYDYIMRPTEEGGLNYKEIIDWINEHGNLNIRY